MSRSLWKGPFLEKALYKNKLPTKIWSRSSTIPSSLVGMSVLVYNGKLFKRILIDRFKVGFKFGEFAFTRFHTSRPKIIKKSVKSSKTKSTPTVAKVKKK